MEHPPAPSVGAHLSRARRQAGKPLNRHVSSVSSEIRSIKPIADSDGCHGIDTLLPCPEAFAPPIANLP